MDIAVLGKGLSLNNFIEIPSVDEYVIVNNFEHIILDNISLKQALTINPTTHIPNRHMMSVEGMLSNNFYQDLNIKQIVSPYIEEMKCQHGGACHCRMYIGNYFSPYGPNGEINIPFKQLNQIHKEFIFIGKFR